MRSRTLLVVSLATLLTVASSTAGDDAQAGTAPHAAPPVWLMHPETLRAGRAGTFVLNPSGSKICFVGVYGPRKGESTGWRFDVNARGLRITLLTHAGASPGLWRVRASCQSHGTRAAVSTASVRVASHGAGMLVRHGDMRVLLLEGRPLMKRYLTKAGGTIRTSGVRMYVPRGVMHRAGWVTISRLPRDRFDLHIWAPWRGHVHVTLTPKRAAQVPHNVVSHLVGGEWVVESPKLGQLTVSVDHLSPFSAITGFVKRNKWVICASSIAGLFVPYADVAAADAAIDCLEAAGQQAISWGIGQALVRILHLSNCDPTSLVQLATKACTVYAPSPPPGAQPTSQPPQTSSGGSGGGGGSSGSSGSGGSSGGSGGSSGGSSGSSGGAGGSASISASQGGPYGCNGCSALDVQVHNFPTGTYTYECHDNSGPGGSDTVFYSNSVTVTDPNQSSWPGVFCDDSAPYVAYLVMDGVTSNAVAFH